MTHREFNPQVEAFAAIGWGLLEAAFLGVKVSQLEALPVRHCIIGQYLVDLPDPYRTILGQVLETDGHHGGQSADAVAKTMREAGLKASATAIRLHRAGTCICS